MTDYICTVFIVIMFFIVRHEALERRAHLVPAPAPVKVSSIAQESYARWYNKVSRAR
jgi:hypothetical protein